MANRLSNYPIIRDSQGEKTNPTGGTTVLADTAALDGGIYEVLVVASASAAAEFVVQVRNAANDANIGDTHIFYAPANTPVSVPFRFEIDADQRVRVLCNADLTGDAVANVFAQRVA